MYPIITIARETASGGHQIAQKIAETLDIPFIDRDFIEEVVKSTGISPEEIKKEGEVASPFRKYFSGSYYNGLPLEDTQDKVFNAQQKIILDYAQKGPCIIVGRCADYILKQAGIPALNVFIHADMDYRTKEMYRRHGGGINAKKILIKNDKERAFYYRYYTDTEWGDYRNYDMVLDSASLGQDLCVEFIIKAAQGASLKYL